VNRPTYQASLSRIRAEIASTVSTIEVAAADGIAQMESPAFISSTS
jgi:hypothetical protein